MKTLLLNCSPKNKFSASSYFALLLTFGQKKTFISEHLSNKSDFERIINQLLEIDTIVFCMPLYVDSVPSHTLEFLKVMETFCKNNNKVLNVYAISNGGFIEGSQNCVLMQIMKNFCERSKNKWKGGLGIGGGVMLNITRILLPIFTLLFLTSVIINACVYNNVFPIEACKSYLLQILFLCFLNSGVLFWIVCMSKCIKKRRSFGEHYTRLLLPSFLFILIADIFFLISSIIKGGFFRGWLSKIKLS